MFALVSARPDDHTFSITVGVHAATSMRPAQPKPVGVTVDGHRER
jgi:hypothetical protein